MVTFLFTAIEIGVIFLLGCLGEIIIQKAGNLNLGTPGIMCLGCAGGCFGVVLSGNVNPFLTILMGCLFAIIFGCLGGLIYCLLTVTFKCNQNVTGLALTIFGDGFASFFINNVVLSNETSSNLLNDAGKNIFNAYLPFADNLGWFGKIFLGHGILVYVAIAIGIALGYLLNRTRVGLNLRAVGESPATADAVGINVTKYKYIFILLGSAIAALGGMMYVMNYMSGVVGATVASTVESLGWLCIALVIFTLWKPTLAILGSILFGGLYILYSYITVFIPDLKLTPAQIKLLPMIPYVITLIVLIVTSIRGKKENLGPASLGLPYFREDR